MNDERIVELLTEMVFKQDSMIAELVDVKTEIKNVKTEIKNVKLEMKEMNKRIEKNTLAISELRLSNMKLIDIIEKQVFERLTRLEDTVFAR